MSNLLLAVRIIGVVLFMYWMIISIAVFELFAMHEKPQGWKENLAFAFDAFGDALLFGLLLAVLMPAIMVYDEVMSGE